VFGRRRIPHFLHFFLGSDHQQLHSMRLAKILGLSPIQLKMMNFLVTLKSNTPMQKTEKK